jgi:hypothetical protein
MKARKTLFQHKIYLVILAALFVSECKLTGGNQSSKAVYVKLDSLLKNKEFFKLEAQFNAEKDKLDAGEQLYFRAYLDNAFNRNGSSAKAIDTLLTLYATQFNDSGRVALLLLGADCYFKLFQYAKDADNLGLVLKQYPGELDSEKLDDIKNKFLLRNALRNTPPQYITKDRVTEIRWTRNKIGLITIPVEHDTNSYTCIFDTRANISSITQTYAKKLGLKMLFVTYDESSGITGIKFKTGLGIADSLYIGNILIRNVVFQVMPDSILYLAPLKLSLDIILGFPLIDGLGEIHILKDGLMIIPQYESSSDLHNFALDGLDPVISLVTGKDTLSFDFDLGAGTTNLFYAFYEKYKSTIIKEGLKKTIHLGGAGGFKEKQVYILPSFQLVLGNRKVTIDSVSIFTKKIYPGEKLYGNIGNDLASQFDELVLNFDKMYIKGN